MKFIEPKVTLLNPSGFEDALPKISADKNVIEVPNNKILSLAVDYLKIPANEFNENSVFNEFMWGAEPGIRIIKKPDFVYVTSCKNLITANFEKYKVNVNLYPDNFEKFYTFKIRCSRKAYSIMEKLMHDLTLELFTVYATVDYKEQLEVIVPPFIEEEIVGTELITDDVAPDRVVLTIMQKQHKPETMVTASNFVAEEACFKQLCTMHPDKSHEYEKTLLSSQVAITCYVSSWRSELLRDYDKIKDKEVLEILEAMKDSITEDKNDKDN